MVRLMNLTPDLQNIKDRLRTYFEAANAQLQRADGELSADDKRILETSKLEIQERKVGTEQAKLFANRQ